MRLGAIILAGGRSVRMGRPKEWLPFGDETLLGHVCRAVQPCCAPIAVAARDAAQPLPPLPADATVWFDDAPGTGPLPALARGLHWLHERHAFTDDDGALLVGCDQPFVDAGIVRRLVAALGDAALLMPRTEHGLHPLPALYRLRVRHGLQRRLAAGHLAVRDLVDEPGARVLAGDALRAIDPALAFLRNLNTPAEYAAALAHRPPGPVPIQDA